MNPRNLVKLSNIVGTVAIVLLLYWVFIFVTTEVFGLKVFRENMTETFYMSVFGILALMFGALILNLMYNLTRIAEKHNADAALISNTSGKPLKWLLILSFPIIAALLFGGDYLTAQKKERLLISSARSIIDSNAAKSEKLANYTFTEEWLRETDNILEQFSKTDKNFPSVSVITRDTMADSKVLLAFNSFYKAEKDTTPIRKKDYLLQTTKPEREYLNKVFDENYTEIRFSAHDGNYQLFYPYIKNGKKIVLYFSDYQRYGKIGS